MQAALFSILRSILFCAALGGASFVLAQGERCTSTLETVAQQVGETVDFCGTPSQVTLRGKHGEGPIFLNFGGKHPYNTFSVVIWGEVAGDEINELMERYTGKALLIHGVVSEYKGKPEIKLAALKDIEVEQE